ncbi:unnamed protein product [Urochloa decumbens]|uniref:Uncharacterized protein n=1 Tax=Urochloa decumbens TaxID=240449 RepID=A0ABC8X0Z4_9POAL
MATTRSSTAAALFLATILLLAAASALAQAPAPAPAPGPSSSPCPLGLNIVGTLTPPQRLGLAVQLAGLRPSDIVRCVCNAANGSTTVAHRILDTLFPGAGGVVLPGGVVTVTFNISALNLNCTRLGA